MKQVGGYKIFNINSQHMQSYCGHYLAARIVLRIVLKESDGCRRLIQSLLSYDGTLSWLLYLTIFKSILTLEYFKHVDIKLFLRTQVQLIYAFQCLFVQPIAQLGLNICHAVILVFITLKVQTKKVYRFSFGLQEHNFLIKCQLAYVVLSFDSYVFIHFLLYPFCKKS